MEGILGSPKLLILLTQKAPWERSFIFRNKNCVPDFFQAILNVSSPQAGEGLPNGLTERLTQGASGTPVHRRECLTILLGTYAENGQYNRPTTNALYSVQPAYALCLGLPGP